MLQDVWKGLAAYGTAIKLLTKQGWWKYALIPGFISLIFAGIVLSLAWFFGDNIGKMLISIYPFEQGREAATTVANIIGGAIIIVAGLILYQNIVMLLVSPWMTKLSIKIEQSVTGRDYIDERSFSVAFSRTVRLNLRIIAREVALIILVFMVGIIPVIDFAVPVLLFLVQAYYAGYGNLDYFMDRRYTVKESVQFVGKNKGIALGNGIGFLLLLMIPVLGVFLAPTLGMSAATLSGIDVAIKNDEI
ncbi:MAG: hypothetical protein RI894_335 [Bacteroidota bacterium]|jgi:CysZ protein